MRHELYFSQFHGLRHGGEHRVREQGRGSRRGKEAEKRKEGKEREGPDVRRGEGGEGRGEHGG